MNAPPRHRRQFKGDRLVTPGATREQITIDYALAPFDRAASAMDEKWGIDRLPELADTETAAKFGALIGYMNAAIEGNDLEAVKWAVENATRGLAKMDADATAAGHAPAAPEIWQIEVDGEKLTFVRDAKYQAAAAQMFPGRRVYTIREAAVALRSFSPALDAAKRHFPQAELAAVRRTEMEELLDDEIKF
jgi:hypothetical protein